MDEGDIENLKKERKTIKVGLVPITKGCSEEKKLRIMLKLFEIARGFEANRVNFEFLGGDKKVDKQFEYLEKVHNFFINL